MSSIGGIGSSSSMMMQSMRGMTRPDPAKMAERLFSKLDTSGAGFIQKSDLQTAFDTASSSSGVSGSTSGTTSVEDLFAQLDSDSDGKVTKQEFSDTLTKLAEQLDNHAMSMRMSGGMQGGGGMGGMGGMPPPPPPQGGQDDAGFTKDELSSQLEEIGSSDSTRSDLISNVVANFDEADTNGDGKVSFKEAMAFDQASASTNTSSSATSSTDTATATSTASKDDVEAKAILQIMRLMQAYGIGNDNGVASSSVSVSA